MAGRSEAQVDNPDLYWCMKWGGCEVKDSLVRLSP